jgi:hypothetical protein
MRVAWVQSDSAWLGLATDKGNNLVESNHVKAGAISRQGRVANLVVTKLYHSTIPVNK